MFFPYLARESSNGGEIKDGLPPKGQQIKSLGAAEMSGAFFEVLAETT